MTDFSLHFEGNWRDGEMPKISGATYVVSFDQTSRAYHIQRDEYDDFIEWSAELWETDNSPREEGESAGDYLDRIGASVREV